MRRTLVLIFLLLLVFIPAFAQDTTSPADGEGTPEDKPAINPVQNTDTSARAYYYNQKIVEGFKTEIARARYDQANLAHRRKTFMWQYDSSKIIFGVVILIVLCGTVFSGMQFSASMREIKMKEKILLARQANKDASTELLPTLQDAKTELDISMQGVKVSSSLIGILILVISIVFFYMYLAFVYPISTMKVDAMSAEDALGPAAVKTETTH